MDTQLIDDLAIQTTIQKCQPLLPMMITYQMMPQFLLQTILDRAIQTVRCTPEEIAQGCQEIYQQWSLTTEAEQQEWRSSYGISQAEFEQFATRSIRLEKFKQIRWGNQIKSYFLQRKSQLDRAIYSMLCLADENLAQELYFRIIEAEQSFSHLAQQYSEGAEAQTGGMVGPVELGTLHPKLANLLSTSSMGQVHLCTLENWYLIVRLEKHIPAQFDEMMRQRLLDEQFEAWLHGKVEQLSDREKGWLCIKPA